LFFSIERTALKKHAGNLLAELDRALVTDILLTVSRLCDPIESGKQKPNLVFERFICKHPKLEPKIGDTLDALKAHYKKRIQPVRNRRLGHNDLSLSRGRRQLGWPTVKAVNKARDLCTEIVYVLHAELKHAAISFVPSTVPGEIDWIEASLRYVNADRLKLKPYLEEVRFDRKLSRYGQGPKNSKDK
jgi:hypothetical protein